MKKRYNIVHKDFEGARLKYGDIILYASHNGKMTLGKITRLRHDVEKITVKPLMGGVELKYWVFAKNSIKASKKIIDRFKLQTKLNKKPKENYEKLINECLKIIYKTNP